MIRSLSCSGFRRYKKGFESTAVDLMEAINVDGEELEPHQSSIDQAGV